MQELNTFASDTVCKPVERVGYFPTSITCFPYLMLPQEQV